MELLCIETHPKRLVEQPVHYPLISDKSPCDCEAVNVGIKDSDPIVKPFIMCVECGKMYRNDGFHWISKTRFQTINN